MTDLIKLNQERWNKAKIHPSRLALFDKVAKRLSAPAAKKRYQTVEKATGVPWWFIAVVHERESGQNFDRSLAQGDPWNKRSVRVPRGRGPFNSWEEAAIDALTNCGPYAARNKDWSIGNALALLEKYNGLGYYNKGIPSPYIWAGTDQYVKGKYIADGKFDPNHVDQQLGVAGLLKRMNIFSKTSDGLGTVATVAVGGCVAASQSDPVYWPWIAGATVIALIVGYVIAKQIKRKAKENGKKS
jgi:lysozyme family protein